MPKAYSYTRFSSPEQAKGDSYRRQTDRAREYARQHGLDLDESVTYHDAAVSGFRGKNIETGALGEFLRLVEAGDIEPGSYLLIESLDRLTRLKARKAARLVEELCEAGIIVVTLQDGHVYTERDLDDMGFILALLIAKRAHEESRTKGDRLKEAWKAKREHAKAKRPLGANCPAWIRLDRERQKYVLIPERAKIVKRIFQQTLQGYGQYTVTEGLNRDRVPVFGRGKQVGKHWHRSYVNKILTSPATYGKLVAYSQSEKDGKRMLTKELEVEKYYPAVIDRQTFNRAQLLIERRTPGRSRKGEKQPAIASLFGGLLKCGRCGSAMTLTNKNKGYRYLVCSRAKVGAKCDYETVSYNQVEDLFLYQSGELLGDIPGPEGAEGDRIARELRSTEGVIDHSVEKIENLLSALERGGADSVTLSKRIRELEEEVAALQRQRDALHERKESLSRKQTRNLAAELYNTLQATPFDRTQANALMRQLFASITFDFDSGFLALKWRQGGESFVVASGRHMFRKGAK